MPINEFLFSRKEMYLVEHNSRGRSVELAMLPVKQKRKKIHENMHLMDGMTFTRDNGFPQICRLGVICQLIFIIGKMYIAVDSLDHFGKTVAIMSFLPQVGATWHHSPIVLMVCLCIALLQ